MRLSTLVTPAPPGLVDPRPDAGSQDALYDEVWIFERVYLSMRRLAGPHRDLDDLAQKALIEVLRSRDRFRGECAAATYVYAICYRVWKKHLRFEVRFSRRFVAGTPFSDSNVAGSSSESATEDESQQLELLLAVERRKALYEALDRLPESKRTALVLHDIEGLETDTIATIVGSPAATVRSRVRDARLKISRQLATHPLFQEANCSSLREEPDHPESTAFLALLVEVDGKTNPTKSALAHLQQLIFPSAKIAASSASTTALSSAALALVLGTSIVGGAFLVMPRSQAHSPSSLPGGFSVRPAEEKALASEERMAPSRDAGSEAQLSNAIDYDSLPTEKVPEKKLAQRAPISSPAWSSAQAALDRGDYDEAELLLQQIVASQSAAEAASTQLVIARVHIKKGDFARARALLEGLVKNSPAAVRAKARLLLESRQESSPATPTNNNQ